MKARSIGPAGMSGRVAAIDAVESDPDVVYAGAATGGVWKSENGGLTFRPLFDDQPVAAIGAIAINQQNPAMVWVGSGEGNVRNSASYGNGVYKSVDGGESWSHLGLAESERIHRIVLHPKDENVAWVAAMGPLWSEGKERGVFKTVDGGKSWRNVLFVDPKTGAADVAIDPSNPNKLYASTWQFRRWPYKFESGGPGSGLWTSTDGGESWKRLQVEDGLPEGELGRIGLAVSRSHPQTVYALVEARKSALLRSDDGGKSWKSVNSEPSINPRPFYFGELRVDPRDANRVYSVDYQVRVSSDGGKSFRTAVPFDLGGSGIHGDHHALWIDPANPEHFYVGNDGGVAVTFDGGKNNRFVSNLPLGQFYHVAFDLDTPYNVYGGLQDNGAWRGPSSVWQQGGIRNHMWSVLVFGDGFETLPDPENSRRGYSMWQGGNLLRWDLDRREYKDVKPAPPTASGAARPVELRFNWNAALAQDPFDAGTIYLGSQFVHLSLDRGESWSTISPDLTSNNPEWQKASTSGGITPDVTNAENFTTLITIALSKLERGLIWTGSDDGRLHVTRDGGKSWSRVDTNLKGVPADTWIPAIEPSPHAAGTAFAVFDNHRRGDFAPYLARSDDFGKSWKSLATPDLRGYALAIVQDPVEPRLLFLGTEHGLWISFDAGQRWQRWRHGVPNASVMDLAIHPREHDLVIGTHGRSVYVLDDILPLRELAAATAESSIDSKLHLFPVADATLIRTLGEDGGYSMGAGEYRGENRAEGALVSFVVSGAGLPLADEVKERARKDAERRAKPAAPDADPKSDAKSETKPEATETNATVEIRDGAGTVVRTLRPKLHQGLNRIAWGLERDGWKQFPSRTPPEPDANPGGPQVPPGAYEIRVKFRGESARATMKVLPDPRSSNSDADWQARWRAVLDAGALRDALAGAVERIRATRGDVDAVLARVRQVNAERLRRREVEDVDLPLVGDGEKLLSGLSELEKTLWQPENTVGIVAETDAASRVSYIQGYLSSSWDPPNASHLEYLRQARQQTASAIEGVNRFFAEKVEPFRAQVEQSGPKLLPALAPLPVP